MTTHTSGEQLFTEKGKIAVSVLFDTVTPFTAKGAAMLDAAVHIVKSGPVK